MKKRWRGAGKCLRGTQKLRPQTRSSERRDVPVRIGTVTVAAMQWKGYASAFLLGGVCCTGAFQWFSSAPQVEKPVPISELGVTLPRSAREKPVDQSLTFLGIQPGDILLSANGIKDQTMLDAAAEGYRQGNLCVVIERKGRNQQICLRKNVEPGNSVTE